jgi:hypothetical protein
MFRRADGEPLARWYSVNYREDRDSGHLVSRGFWVHLPRPLMACRIAGHKPVIDGYEGFRGRPMEGARWVCCDRCGLRPDPQGCLDPSAWAIGTPVRLGVFASATRQPGRAWPRGNQGVVGGQLVVGRGPSCGVSVKVGNCGSEHTLAAHVLIPWAGALYLHTERFGTWMQRRLNPAGYESKVIEADIGDGRLHWKAWAPRDGGPPGSRWRAGSVRVDPRDILLGERRYQYEDAVGPEPVTLTLPDGSQHPIAVRLKRQSRGRRRGRAKLSWSVSCDSKDGIPYDGTRGGMNGWSVPVSDDAVTCGLWQQEAVAASIVKVTQLRVRYGWKPKTCAA